MKQVECEFESETLAAALQGRWPDRLDAELSAHIAGCALCSDVALAASAVEALGEDARAHAIPDSGRVWWLSQLRARREAAETAGSPITAAQVIAFAAGAGLVGACFGATSTWFQSMLHWVASHSFSSAEALAAVQGFPVTGLAIGLVIALATLLFLVPLAVYLAMGRD